MRALEERWYRPSLIPWLLLPVSAVYCSVVLLRRTAYRMGLRSSYRLPVPVVVVGNVTVGGTGKTPLVVWLAQFLKEAGYRPGLVARGYRGRARHWPQQVRPDSDPQVVGDEAVLLARRSGCPMAVGPDRVAAAQALLEHNECDVILSDDGLQHYALKRDVEIAVIDGVRRFGNGHCLPAGPLREPKRRLAQADLLVSNGPGLHLEHPMKLRLGAARRLDAPDYEQALERFRGQRVRAVAGIGNPQRFFSALQALGLQVEAHPFPDHHAFVADDFAFGDAAPVLMTEKDAVKCVRFAAPNHWYVPVDAVPDERLGAQVLALLNEYEPEKSR